MSGDAILFVRMLAPRAEDADFTEWYTSSHLPGRLEVPGFLSGRTYRDADGALVAVYELEDAAVLESPAYLRVQADDAAETKARVAGLDEFQRLVLTAS